MVQKNKIRWKRKKKIDGQSNNSSPKTGVSEFCALNGFTIIDVATLLLFNSTNPSLIPT